jgi:hypothetical protein
LIDRGCPFVGGISGYITEINVFRDEVILSEKGQEKKQRTIQRNWQHRVYKTKKNKTKIGCNFICDS